MSNDIESKLRKEWAELPTHIVEASVAVHLSASKKQSAGEIVYLDYFCSQEMNDNQFENFIRTEFAESGRQLRHIYKVSELAPR